MADLSSCSPSDSAKYKRACLKAKVICSYIWSAGECPDAYSRVLYIALNHKEKASIMAVTGAILPKKCQCNNPTWIKEKYCPMQHQLGINKNKYKTEKLLSYPILCPLCHLHLRKQIKTNFTQLRIYFNIACRVHIFEKKGFHKTWAFDCSISRYRVEIVYQTMHRSNKIS